MSNKFNDKNNFKYTKGGSSSSKVDFLKGGTDFIDQELNDTSEDEILTAEELADPELAIEIDQEDFIEEESIVEDKSIKNKSNIVRNNVVAKKPITKKPDVVDKIVDKDVNKMVRDLVKDVSVEETRSIIHVSKKQKDQMATGNMSFLGRDNATTEEKREFLNKLDEIVSSDDVSNANASFVMKWLKNRK